MIDETEKMLNQLEINFKKFKNPESAGEIIESLKMKLNSLKSDSSSSVDIHNNSPSSLNNKSQSQSFSEAILSSPSNNIKSKSKRKVNTVDKMDKVKNNSLVESNNDSSNSVKNNNKQIKNNHEIEELLEKERSKDEMFEHIEDMLEQLNNPDILKNMKKREKSNENNSNVKKIYNNENVENLGIKHKIVTESIKEVNKILELKTENKSIDKLDLENNLELKKNDLVKNSKDLGVNNAIIETVEKNINGEKKRKVNKRKVDVIEKNTGSINESKSNKKTRSSPRRSKSNIDKEKENNRNNNNGSLDKELKKKNSEIEKLENNSPSKSKVEEHGFKLYQKRMQEKRRKLQENNNKINESFTRINEKEKLSNESLVQEKNIIESIDINNKEKKNVQLDEQNITLLDISPTKDSIKDNNSNLIYNKNELNNNSSLNKNDDTISIKPVTLSKDNESPSLNRILNVNSVNVTPIKPTSILKKSSTGSSKKKSVSFDSNINIKIIPSIPQTKKVPIRSPKKTDDITSFFASLSSPSKPSKQTIFSKFSAKLLNQYGLSPLSNRKFIRPNKSNSSLYTKNNLFIDDKSLRSYSKVSNLNKVLDKNNPERKFAEVSKKLNQIFSIPYNSKPKESPIIKNMSLNKDSLFHSPNNSTPFKEPIFNNENVIINNAPQVDNNKLDNDNTDKQQFKEIKSNTDVMEKIFMNDDRENVETKEKNYNDFNILKKLVSCKEKSESDSKTGQNDINKLQNENDPTETAYSNSIKAVNKELNAAKEKSTTDTIVDSENSNKIIDNINKSKSNDINMNDIVNKNERKHNDELIINTVININDIEIKGKKDKSFVNKSVVNLDNNNNNCKNNNDISFTNNVVINLINGKDKADDIGKDDISIVNDTVVNHDMTEDKNKNNSIINNNFIIDDKNKDEYLITDNPTINHINNINEELLFSVKQNKFNIEKNEAITLENNDAININDTTSNEENKSDNIYNDENESEKINIHNIDNVIIGDTNKPVNQTKNNVVSIDNINSIMNIIKNNDINEKSDEKMSINNNNVSLGNNKLVTNVDVNDINGIANGNNELLTNTNDIMIDNKAEPEINTNIFAEEMLNNSENQEKRISSKVEDNKDKEENSNIPENSNNNNITDRVVNNNNSSYKIINNESLLSQPLSMENSTIDAIKDKNNTEKENESASLNDNDNMNEKVYSQENIDVYMELDEYLTQNNDNLLLNNDNGLISDNNIDSEENKNKVSLNEYQYSIYKSEDNNILANENSVQQNSKDSIIPEKITYCNDNHSKENFIKDEIEYKKGLQFIENHIGNNKYYQSMKMFYDMFTPSNENLKIFEIGNNKSKEHDNENITNCVCQDCMICKNRSFNNSISNNNFEIDYSNWKFY